MQGLQLKLFWALLLFRLLNFSGETLFIQGAIPKIEREKILSNYGDLINSKRLVLADSYLRK